MQSSPEDVKDVPAELAWKAELSELNGVVEQAAPIDGMPSGSESDAAEDLDQAGSEGEQQTAFDKERVYLVGVQVKAAHSQRSRFSGVTHSRGQCRSLLQRTPPLPGICCLLSFPSAICS